MLKSSRSLTLTLALSTLYSLGVGLLGPIYPIFVVNRFSATLMDLGLLYAIFCLTAALFKIIAGKLADKYGKERILFASVMMGAMCYLGYIYVQDIIQLYIIEFLFGASYALQRPAILAMIVELGGKNGKSTVLGIFESVYDLTEAAAALLSTVIATKIGFETLFFICSGCQATTGVFILKCKR
ncbi:MAG: MFS transporter [Nitrososphaerota archaeon]|nr:MFS transporter [Candidatus Bathyarchaeota archaeon]MDW8022993.1 MFS transporter [Nitrososphaerota archaeon]